MYTTNTNYSKRKYRFSKTVKTKNPYQKFKIEKKLTSQFETFIESLTVEELLAIKLYMTTRCLNGKFVFNCFPELNQVVEMAVLLYVMMNYNSMPQWADTLGINLIALIKKINKHKMTNYVKFFLDDIPVVEHEDGIGIEEQEILDKFKNA